MSWYPSVGDRVRIGGCRPRKNVYVVERVMELEELADYVQSGMIGDKGPWIQVIEQEGYWNRKKVGKLSNPIHCCHVEMIPPSEEGEI